MVSSRASSWRLRADFSRYPWHLRPRNKQTLHFVRMANDMVRDLDLDQDFRNGGEDEQPEAVTDEQLERIRTFLGQKYLASA